MAVYKKPARWADPANRLFPHQVGFTAPPHDFDAVPTDFLRMAPKGVGIRFIPGALRWEPGARDEVSWWDGGSFHENLRSSDGLKPQKTRPVDIATAPDRVRAAWEVVIAHYEHMHAYRLQVPAAAGAIEGCRRESRCS